MLDSTPSSLFVAILWMIAAVSTPLAVFNKTPGFIKVLGLGLLWLLLLLPAAGFFLSFGSQIGSIPEIVDARVGLVAAVIGELLLTAALIGDLSIRRQKGFST